MSEEQPSPESRRRWKRRLIWASVFVAVLIAMVLTPPLVNVNRLARRIADNMSQSLGRPVHLDNVTLNLLPVPGFTLQNLVVSEDPSFGAEPVIRANTVVATLRVSSLWRRHVEFGTVRFEDPSVNLVRRADGRWNLESILLHAAQQNTAPTAQATASEAPRFPYIEATGARLNVKLGDEKEPLALTETNFALWLPSPQQWRVRLTGKPARTDTSVSDTGVVSVEATLQRAAQLADVPVEMTASWRRAPLGEASRLLTGQDAGWRGNVDVTAIAHGTLGEAALSGTVTLSEVRRADFIPAKTLHAEVECRGRLAANTATLREASCTLPFGDKAAPSAMDTPRQSVIAATVDTLNLTGLRAQGLRVGMTNVRDDWWLDLARLFSQRLPAALSLEGSVSGSAAATDGGAWQGEFHGTFAQAGTASEPRPFSIAVSGNSASGQAPADSTGVNGTLDLTPVNISVTDKGPSLMLAAQLDPQTLDLHMNGAATVADLQRLRSEVPPLFDGVDQVLPGVDDVSPEAGTATVKMDLTCQRVWGRGQTCSVARVPEAAKKPRRRR